MGWLDPAGKSHSTADEPEGASIKGLENTLSPEDKGDYEHLCSAMEGAFDPPERVLTHKVAFKTRIRHAKETPSEFTHFHISI